MNRALSGLQILGLYICAANSQYGWGDLVRKQRDTKNSIHIKMNGYQTAKTFIHRWAELLTQLADLEM